MKYKHRLEPEEKTAIEMGFLPAPDSIYTIVSNTNYYAVIHLPSGEESYCMLVGWAYLKNGICMPLIYDAEFHTLRNPEVIKGFLRVTDEDGDEDEDEQEKIL